MLTLVAAARAQVDTSNLIAWCDGKFALCGYFDKTTRQQMIEPRFEHAMRFSEGLAAVVVHGKFGYIDGSGTFVIMPVFDFAGEFREGHAEILIGDKAGVIDRSGRIIVPPMFARAVPWTKDVILAMEGTSRSLHSDGYERLTSLKMSMLSQGPVGLYHVAGFWIRKPDLRSVSRFNPDGGAPIWASHQGLLRGGLYGLLDADGGWLVEPQYDSGGTLSDGRAVVRKRVDGEMLSGMVGPTGEIVLPLRAAQQVLSRQNGWTIVREPRGSTKEGFIDDDGNLIGGRYFDEVRRPYGSERDIASVRIDGLWKGLDRAGNIVPHPDNGRVTASCPNGVRVVAQDGKVQITDAAGRPTVPYLLDPVTSKPDCVKPFAVHRGDKYGYVAPDGRPLFDPPVFDNQYAFEDGYAVVRHNRKWGIIDTRGRFVQPAKFDEYKGKRDGVFQFVLGGREIWITASGEERPVPPVTYTPLPKMLDCGHGMKLFERDGKWGIVEQDGREVIAPRYRALSCFYYGVAWAAIDERRAWCPLGPDGDLRILPKCQISFYPYMSSHTIPERFSDDPFESSVLWRRAYLEFHSGKRDIPPGWTGDGGQGGAIDKVRR
jgi:hypothetical protein